MTAPKKADPKPETVEVALVGASHGGKDGDTHKVPVEDARRFVAAGAARYTK